MQIKLYYKNQKELAYVLNTVIDKYYNDEIDEATLEKLIFSLLRNNESKFFKDNNFTSTINQRCGKRRLELLEKIIKKEDRGGDFEKSI